MLRSNFYFKSMFCCQENITARFCSCRYSTYLEGVLISYTQPRILSQQVGGGVLAKLCSTHDLKI